MPEDSSDPVAAEEPVEDTVDVVVVGGGPAGSSAAVLAARYGLDVVVFDRGNAALRRCAVLENYLGFPGGVDVDAFHDLMHAHVAETGARRVEASVDAVDRLDPAEPVDRDTDARFRVRTTGGTTVDARDVVAAAWYDGSYLRPLDDDGGLFAEHEHHGEVEERFDPEYADADGRTPIEGLYVASPAGARSAQAIVAAGNGAHVARSLLADRRRERGYSGGVVPEYDWARRASEFSGEWADRDRWRAWFENELADDDELDDAELAHLRDEYVEAAFDTCVDEDEASERAAHGLERIVDVVGADVLVDAVGSDRFLTAIDDSRVREHLSELDTTPEGE
jgi:threonine dehydrogenase-like Zn-dependent dehydrogenase